MDDQGMMNLNHNDETHFDMKVECTLCNFMYPLFPFHYSNLYVLIMFSVYFLLVSFFVVFNVFFFFSVYCFNYVSNQNVGDVI